MFLNFSSYNLKSNFDEDLKKFTDSDSASPQLKNGRGEIKNTQIQKKLLV